MNIEAPQKKIQRKKECSLHSIEPTLLSLPQTSAWGSIYRTHCLLEEKKMAKRKRKRKVRKVRLYHHRLVEGRKRRAFYSLESSTHQDHGPHKIAWNKVSVPLPTLPP